MDKLEFSTNWNGKLFLDNFGTIRLHNEAKYHIDAIKEVYIRGTYLGIIKIVSVKTILYKNISDGLAYLDTGKNAAYLKSLLTAFYQKKVVINDNLELDHIVCQYTSRHIENFEALLRDWWQSQIDRQPHLSKQQTIWT